MCDSNLIKNLQMSEQNNLKSEQRKNSEENNKHTIKNKNKKGVS